MRRQLAGSKLITSFALCALLLFSGCQTPTLEESSPVDTSLQGRIARIQQALDAEFRVQRAAPAGPARDQRLGALSNAQGRLSSAETMAYGATVTQDPIAKARVENTLRILEAELGISN